VVFRWAIAARRPSGATRLLV